MKTDTQTPAQGTWSSHEDHQIGTVLFDGIRQRYQLNRIADTPGGSDRTTEEAADLIVRAVNSHQALIDTLSAILEFAGNRTPIHPGALVLDDARAALKLATEGSR